MDNENTIAHCVRQIVRLFYYDSITLLDNVLSEDTDEPEYSANTAYQRLAMVAAFYNLSNEAASITVETIMEESGYSSEDILRLQRKRANEARGHNRLCKEQGIL